MNPRLVVFLMKRSLVQKSLQRSLNVAAPSKSMGIHSSAKPSQSSTLNLGHRSNAHASSVTPPSFAQLKTLFISSAIPMFAFGFMDNLIMIQAGGYIDATFGAALGLATLSAAAMGQVVSDVSGVIFGSTVERLLQRYDIAKSPCLSNAQRRLPLVRNVTMVAMVVGVTFGCLLGASSLLFVDLHAHERQKRTAQLKDVIMDMVNDDDLSVACQQCHIHLKATGTFDKSETPAGPQIRLLSEGPAANCARDQVALVEDKHMYVPIVSKQQTLGVLEFVAESFSPEDQRTARIMARHVAIFMERLADSD
jgi:hypothetical protein